MKIIDIERLSKLVVKKIKDHEVYCEMPLKDLQLTMQNYLEKFYDRKIHRLHIDLSLKKTKGGIVTAKDYKEAAAEAQHNTIKQAYALGAIDYDDLAALKELSKL